MSREYVTIARTSAGAHGRAAPGDPVEVPIDDLRDSRGLITGAPDAGIDDAATLLADRLLAAGQSVLLVDADGSHRDLARRHGARLAGDDPDCDVRPSRGNAERIATIVGENDESVVLDCSSFTANSAEVLGSVADALDRSRHRQSSLVVLLTGCHEWLPDAGESACGEALDALGRADAAPGVGVVGITDRPSGVDSHFRRNCDWIAAHRVSWREHVDAVARILGRKYDDALEDLDDGEAFLDGPWASAVQRVQFERVDSGRRTSSDRAPDRDREQTNTPTRHSADARSEPRADVADVSAELSALRDRIDDLEATVDDRNEVETIAGDLADAIADRLDDRDVAPRETATERTESPSLDLVETESTSTDDGTDGGNTETAQSGSGGFGNVFDAFDDAGGSASSSSTDEQTTSASGRTTEASSSTSTSTTSSSDRNNNGSSSDGGGMSFEPANFAFDEGVSGGETSPDGLSTRRSRSRSGERRVPRYVRDLVRTVEEMDPTTRQMLAHYVDRGADTPMNAHFSAGGSDDRTSAYAHNRRLRTTGFVDHVGRGHYAPTIPEKVRDEADSGLSQDAVKKATEHIRRALP